MFTYWCLIDYYWCLIDQDESVIGILSGMLGMVLVSSMYVSICVVITMK